MKKIILSMMLFLLLISGYVTADRPSYNFSDDVFDDLPTFPDDFFEIKDLFITQRITAWHLGEEYLQPELIPQWEYWSEEVYSDENYTHFGLYGMNFYPSLFDVFEVEKGDVFNISFLMRADWGIRFYQGCRIILPEIDGLSLSLVYPTDSSILFSPTYPKFVVGWLQKGMIRVEVLKKQNYSFILREGRPNSIQDKLWSNSYGNDYISIGKLTSSVLRVNIYEKQVMKEKEDSNMAFLFNLFLFIFLCLITIIILSYLIRRYDAKRRKAE